MSNVVAAHGPFQVRPNAAQLAALRRHCVPINSWAYLLFVLGVGFALAGGFATAAWVIATIITGDPRAALLAAPFGALFPVPICAAFLLRFWRPRRLSEERCRRLCARGYLAQGVIAGQRRPSARDTGRICVDVALDWPVPARLEVETFFVMFERPPPAGTRIEIVVDPSDWSAGYVGPLIAA